MTDQDQRLGRSGRPGSPRPELWTIITGEYPPQPGGVSDYTFRLADALAQEGNTVDVWCPGRASSTDETGGVRVHRVMGSFSVLDLLRAQRRMPRDGGSRRVLIQWVPHAYGQRAVNLGVCAWLWWRSVRQGERLELVIHETFLEFSRSWKQRAAALIHRVMIMVLFRAVVRVWVTVPGWEARLRPFLLARRVPFQWLPVPSSVPVVDLPIEVDAARATLGGHEAIRVGHFGTYGKHVAALLRPMIHELLARDPRIVIVLLGRGSVQFREELVVGNTDLAPRIVATGGLAPSQLSIHLSACDIMLQPFPDGVSSRRSSAMAGISHGVPLVTTRGTQTERSWEAAAGVALVEASDSMGGVSAVLRWAADTDLRRMAGQSARDLYDREFSLPRMLSRLRSATALAT